MRIRVAAAALLLIAAPAAATEYHLTILGEPTPVNAQVNAISPSGQIAGSISNFSQQLPALFDSSGTAHLLNPPVPDATAVAVDDHGNVLINTRNVSLPETLLFSNGQWTYTADASAGVRLVARHLLPDGTPVGDIYSTSGSLLGAGVFRNGQIQTLYSNGIVLNANHVGDILGDQDVLDNVGHTDAFFILHPDGSRTPIPIPAGYTRISPVAIDDKGTVLGTASGGVLPPQNFIWTPSSLTLLPRLNAYPSFPVALNNRGVVVGEYENPDSSLTAWIYHDGQIELLDSLTDQPGFHYQEIRGINDAGEIIGMGYTADWQARAFLLTPLSEGTPVPEPASLLLLPLALVAWTCRSRLRR